MAKFLKRYRYPYLFIMPFFFLFLVFQLVPNLWTVYISLTEWNGIGEPRFTGAQNYRMLFKDYMFWDALKNTVIYWITGVILILALGLLISGLLNYNRLRGKAFFKSATYLPNICAVIAMGIIFSMLFEKNTGLINEVIFAMGGNKVDWLTGTRFSKIPVIALNVWRNTPWFTMILLSGLLNISPEYYEAASIDGATLFQKLRCITLPLLKPVLVNVTVLNVTYGLRVFDMIYSLTNGGPGNATGVINTAVYKEFSKGNLAMGTTLSSVLFFVMLALLYFIIKSMENKEVEA